MKMEDIQKNHKHTGG